MQLSAYIDNLSDISGMAEQFEKLTNTVVEIECDETDEGVWYKLFVSDADTDKTLLSKGFCGMEQIFSFVETMLKTAKIAARAE